MTILFSDTETNSLSERRLVECAFQSWNIEEDKVNDMVCELVRPAGWIIHQQAYETHNIPISRCYDEGVPVKFLLENLLKWWGEADFVFFHNSSFDLSVINGEVNRLGMQLPATPVLCSMKLTKDICKVPNKNGKGIKNPSLNDLHKHCFHKPVENAHSGKFDVIALRNSIRFLIQSGQLSLNQLNPTLL